MEESFGVRKTKSGTLHRRVLRMGLALAIERDLMNEVPGAIQRIKGSAKVIALKLGKTPRCIEGLRQGQHIPSLPVALALARLDPQFREVLKRHMDAETGESDENPARVLDEIQKLLMQRGAR